MKLSYQGIQDRAVWEQAGIALPKFDWKSMRAETEKNPTWVHFGAGNIFRGFIARLQHRLLDQGLVKSGIIAADTFDYDIIDKIYTPFDNMTLMVSLLPDGSLEKDVVASIAQGLRAGAAFPEDMERLKAIFRSPSLQMVSYTITEKGYALQNIQGEFFPFVQADFDNGPAKCSHAMSMTAALLLERFNAGGTPIAIVSMDNCSHNGEKLRSSVMTVVDKWLEKGHVSQEFAAWVRDEEKVSFPWSMIDKITPRPDASVEEILKKDGVEELEPVITSKNTYVAPFVNAEECEYLVIEDAFPNGRPRLEAGGLMFTDRQTVDKVEKMKVCTCLNPLHTALAVFGCLLGYDLISKEMKDETLKKLVEEIGYVEGLPVVINPGILDPKEFIDTVVNVRIPNPFMPDTPQRIATDTSQKLAIRYGETIKAYAASDSLKVSELRRIPLVFAGWLRYLMAVDDAGAEFTLSPDPLLKEVCPYVADIKLGQEADVETALKPVLSNSKIFGIDLYEAGLAELVCGYFREMTAGVGAVRRTLEKYV